MSKFVPDKSYLATGLCYLEGTGVIKDEKLAFHLIKLGAEKGDVVAMVNAALLSTNGCGTTVDYRLGINLVPFFSFFSHYLQLRIS
jgi:TPR repeat protein